MCWDALPAHKVIGNLRGCIVFVVRGVMSRPQCSWQYTWLNCGDGLMSAHNVVGNMRG